MSVDVVIIGAGHNGLTCAAYLAKAGRRVIVVERREVVGGCAVTEEIDAELEPGCRVSTASYIASMLRPEVIRDLRLADYGLTMVACEPGVQAAFEDGSVLGWWSDDSRLKQEISAVAPDEVDTFFEVQSELESLAACIEPWFLESPPDIFATGWRRLRELWRLRRHLSKTDAGQIAGVIRLASQSLGEVVEQRFLSEKLHRLILANSLYGKHGGPYSPGSAFGLLFHLLSGGHDRMPGFQGHVIGGMGAISDAIAQACRDLGVDIRTETTVSRINVANGKTVGVTLADGATIDAPLVVSNADPRRTLLGLIDAADLDDEYRQSVRRIRMNGPAAKVNFVLAEEPRVTGMPEDRSPSERSLFTLVPTLEQAQSSYEAARRGEVPSDLWVDCVVASNVDRSLVTEGRHVMTCFVQYVPYWLREGSWDDYREPLGDRVTEIIAGYAPNVPGSVLARDILTPVDLEERFGITEGNIFHGDISPEQLFFMRPVAGSAGYQTPIEGLYLCGAGTHPGGGVTGAPGHNAAKTILRR